MKNSQQEPLSGFFFPADLNNLSMFLFFVSDSLGSFNFWNENFFSRKQESGGAKSHKNFETFEDVLRIYLQFFFFFNEILRKSRFRIFFESLLLIETQMEAAASRFFFPLPRFSLIWKGSSLNPTESIATSEKIIVPSRIPI